MGLRALLITLTLLAAMLAGCTSNEEPASVDLTTQEGQDPADEETTGDGAAVPAETNETEAPGGNETEENTLPTAGLTLSAEEVEAGEEVNITIEGSDEDGDDLTWTLDVGNDGEADAEGTGADLPYNHTVAFEEAGEHDIVLTVSDGTDEVVDTITVIVLEAAGEDAPEPVVIEGTAMAPNPAHPFICLGDGIDGDTHEIAPAEGGWSVELTSGFALYWWNDEGYVGNDAAAVPEGATLAEVCSASAVAASYTLTLSPPA